MNKILLSLCLCLLAVPSFAGTPVTLRPLVELRGSAIRLADVFEGVPDQLDRDIALAPEPGKSVTYDLRVLTKLAEDYRLDWQPQSVADKSILTRAAIQITPDMVSTAILDKLSQASTLRGKTLEVVFDNRNAVINLPVDSSTDFELANFSYDEKNKRFRSEILALAGTAPVTQTVSGRVVVKKPVPVLTRRLAAGDVISQGDLMLVVMQEDRLGSDVLDQPSLLIGQSVKHDQAEGEFLRAHEIMPQKLVTKGSLVTLKIETPAMLITAQGKALQDGGKGDTIRVTNTQSQRTIEGTVEGTGIVRIGTQQQLLAANTAP